MILFPIFEVLLMLYPTCFTSRALRFPCLWSLTGHPPCWFFPCLLAALTNHGLCSETGKSAVSKALLISSYTSTCKHLSSSPVWELPPPLSFWMVWWVPSVLRLPPSKGRSQLFTFTKNVFFYHSNRTRSLPYTFIPETKKVMPVYVIELTLLRTDYLGSLSLHFLFSAYAMEVFLHCSNRTFWYTVGRDYMCDDLLLKHWSISLPPSILIHLLSWIILSNGVQVDVPRWPLHGYMKIK